MGDEHRVTGALQGQILAPLVPSSLPGQAADLCCPTYLWGRTAWSSCALQESHRAQPSPSATARVLGAAPGGSRVGMAALVWPEQLRDGKRPQGHQRSKPWVRPLCSKSPLVLSPLLPQGLSPAPAHCQCRGPSWEGTGKQGASMDRGWRLPVPRAGLRPISPSELAETGVQSYLLMREMQSSAWLRSGELLRLFRFSPSLTRDCSTVLQEAVEGGQAFSGGGGDSDTLRSRAGWLQGPRQHRGPAKDGAPRWAPQ